MVAFHYPPCSGTSGVHRTLKFSRFLPEHGWEPSVLTVDPRAYPVSQDDQLRDVPPGVAVTRAFGVDAARHLAIRGRYPKLFALPDRWSSWWLAAVPTGLRLIRRHRPRLIWSTYPIATSPLIALALHRASGVPWVADLRDSMTEDDYPRDPAVRRCYRWIERRTMVHAARVVFTAPSTREMYLKRYPWLSADRCVVIPNGYDEEDFERIVPTAGGVPDTRPVRLLHAGVLYPEERDPRPFLRAVARLKQEGRLDAASVTIELRAPGSERYYATMVAEMNLADVVRLLPALPYRRSLEDCASASGLLLFQGASCNHQIPAKTYEYLRVGRPILGLTTDEGDTAEVLREAGGATIVAMDDERAIHAALPRFVAAVRAGTHPLPDRAVVGRYTRGRQTGDLARCLDGVAESAGTAAAAAGARGAR